MDIQWESHDVVWMGAAAGSPICILAVLKTTLAYNHLDVLEVDYDISLRTLEQMADHIYASGDVTLWRPKDETKGGPKWQVSTILSKGRYQPSVL